LLDPRPIELLRIGCPLDADQIAALSRAKVFSRVHRLQLDACLDDDAMAALTSDPGLRHTADLSLTAFHDLSAAAFAMLVNCPHWHSLRSFDYGVNVEEAAQLLARSPLLPRLVSLGSFEYEQAQAIPAVGALPRLRRVNEMLTLTIFTDAREARKWLAAGPSVPLRAKLEAFIRRIYSVDDPRTIQEIAAELEATESRGLDFDERQRRVSAEVTALLAKVFRGQPVPAGTPLADLTAEQQQALRLIGRIGQPWWNVDTVLREPLASYGFDFYEEAYQDFLAGQRVSE
jgi:hypothetical protein